MLLGALMGGYFVLMFVALQTASPVSTAAVFTLIPLMSAGFGYLILAQTTRPVVIISLIVAGIGAIWVIFRGDIHALIGFDVGKGEMIFFVGCMFHAAYSPLVKRLNRGESVMVFTFWTLVASAFWISLYGMGEVLSTDWQALPLIVWITIGYLAVFTTAGTFFLLQFAALRLPSSKVLAYGYLTPSIIILLEGWIGHGWVGLPVAFGALITIVGLIVMNFTRPTGDKPALLSFDETLTFFHEFGHALHSLFNKSHYLKIGVATDFVELPSQIMENWAAHPKVLKTYAKHYQTGEVIPDELIAKMEAASKFNQGFVTVEYTAASILDMDYHTLKEASGLNANAFEKASMKRIGLIDEIIPRYKSNYFQHIFAGGYSAGYYSYMWSEVLDKDAFNAFVETSLFDQATATSFRENILEKGGSVEEMEMYVNFRGAEPTIEPLLKGRGLN